MNQIENLTAAAGEIAEELLVSLLAIKISKRDTLSPDELTQLWLIEIKQTISTNPTLVAMVNELEAQTKRANEITTQYLKDQLPNACKDWESVWNNHVQLVKERDQLQTKCDELQNQLNSIHHYCDSDIMYNEVDIAYIKKLSLNSTTKP